MKRPKLLRFSASPLLRLMLCLFLTSGWILQVDAQPLNHEYVCGSIGGVSGPIGGGPENPICSDPSAVRYIRVAVHFLLREDTWAETITDNCSSAIPPYSLPYVGPGNFTETNDGVGNPAYTGFQHAENFIGLANEMLATNETQWRKASGIAYPENPAINIQYLLVGVYFHRDNEAFDGSKPEQQIHAKYDVQTNQVLDIYCIHRPNLGYDGNGFQFGGSNKFVYLNDYYLYLKPNCRDWSKINTAHSLNHEIGHTLNLYHTWSGPDLCNDTPEGYIYDNLKMGICTTNVKANCWDYRPSIAGCPRKPCDDWSKISNNVMDYNSYDPAWTECQIARINQNLEGNGNAYIHSCNGCAPSQAFFYVPSPQAICPPLLGGSNVILNGQPSVNENRYLIEICEVLQSLPSNCNAGYFTSGWQVGGLDKVHLSLLYTFQPNKIYKIKLTVDNTECPGSDVHEQLVYTHNNCSNPPPCCYDMAVTNPFNSYLTVYYSTPENGVLSLALINVLTGSTTTLTSPTQVSTGTYQQDFQTAGLPNGNYTLRAVFNGSVYTKNIVKI